MSATHLLSDGADDFERGFQLGIIWQQLRAGLDQVDIVVPVALVAKAHRLGSAIGYRLTVRKPPGLPGLRFLRFRSVKGGT